MSGPFFRSANALDTLTWFSHRGMVMKRADTGGLVYKSQYDGAGRLTVSYVTDGLGDSTWADAGSVASNNVLSQSETQYDSNSNAMLQINRQRFDNETTTGALGNPTTAPLARVSFSASYYDLANQVTTQVNVGTNGGTAWTRPSSPPTASDTVLVTALHYNTAGWVDTRANALNSSGILRGYLI